MRSGGNTGLRAPGFVDMLLFDPLQQGLFLLNGRATAKASADSHDWQGYIKTGFQTPFLMGKRPLAPCWFNTGAELTLQGECADKG